MIQHVRLCDLADPRFSRITVVQQYLSHMLAEDSPRLRLLWASRDAAFESFEEWAVAFPDLALLLERGILVASSWTYRRLTEFETGSRKV